MTDTAAKARELSTILAETASTLERLTNTLELEYQQVASPAKSNLTALVADKEAALGRLAELDAMRRALLTPYGKEQSTEKLEELFAALDPNQDLDLRLQWEAIVHSIGKANRLNEINGATINLSRAHLEAFLSILRKDDTNEELYGPSARRTGTKRTKSIAQA